MKPQTLQDEIKRAASRKIDRFSSGQWQEPTVKSHKVTADDMKIGKRSKSTATGLANGNGDGGPATAALQQELELLRQEMRTSLKQIRQEQEALSKKSAAASSQSPSNEMSEELQSEVASLASELNSLKSDFRKVQSVTKDVQNLQNNLHQLEDHVETISSNHSTAANSNGHQKSSAVSSSDEALAKDVRKCKSEIKELRMLVSQSKDGERIAKELRVTVEQQESMLEKATEDIETLQEEVRMLKRRLEKAEFIAQEAKDLVESESSQATIPVQAVAPPSPQMIIPRKEKGLPRESAVDNEDESSSESSVSEEELIQSPAIHAAAARNKREQQMRLQNEAKKQPKLKLLDLDSEDESSNDGSDLFPAISARGSNTASALGVDGNESDSSGSYEEVIEEVVVSDEDEEEEEETLPVRPKPKVLPAANPVAATQARSNSRTNFSPSAILGDLSTVKNTKKDDSSSSSDSSSGSSSSSSSSSAPPPPKKAAPRRKPTRNTPARSTSFDRDLEDVPRGSTQPLPPRRARRRQSTDSVNSMTSTDDDEIPQRKTISLLPHRSENLYQEQRKDAVLRKFIVKGKAPNMTVHRVHGRNLVFFSDKVYIPASLRKESMEYYHKKYKYDPLHAIQKHCFWPDIEEDCKRYAKKDRRWRVVQDGEDPEESD